MTWSAQCSAVGGIISPFLNHTYVNCSADYRVDVASWSCYADPYIHAGIDIKQLYENTAALLNLLSACNVPTVARTSPPLTENTVLLGTFQSDPRQLPLCPVTSPGLVVGGVDGQARHQQPGVRAVLRSQAEGCND